MNPRVDQFVKMFEFGNRVFEMALDGIKPEDLHKNIASNSASIQWYAGHIVNSRYYLANQIGASEKMEFSNLYNGDRTPLKEPGDYPSIEEIKKEFDAISVKLIDGLKKLSDAELDKNIGDKWPHGEDTAFGAISFMCWHEGWHFGQISTLRKHLGYKGLAG